MRFLKLCAGCLVFCALLSGAAYADASVGPQNDPGASVDSRLSKLLGEERASFTEVSPDRIAAITTPPVKGYETALQAIQYSDAWLGELPQASGGKQWTCLAKAIYFEARGESVKGEFAVAEVIANRVDSSYFPDNFCAVVHQGDERRDACQFSYACDGRPDTIHEQAAFEKAGKIAKLIMEGAPRTLTDGATYFHTVWVHPPWSHQFQETAEIGAHVFYRNPVEPVQVAAN
nr:cell wall hydrolase [Solirhodobacter olei]